MHVDAPAQQSRKVEIGVRFCEYLGNILLLLRFMEGLVEVGEFFDVGESIDLKSVLRIERVVVHGGDGKLGIIHVPEVNE